MPSSENRAVVEFDGFPPIVALECKPPKKTHTNFEHHPLNQPYPDLGRGNYKCEEMTFKHAHGVGQALQAFSSYYDEYLSGRTVEKLNGRVIMMDEAGRSAETTYVLIDCVMTGFEPDNMTGSGTNVATATITLRPTDYYQE